MIFWVNVGKYSSTMEHLGIVIQLWPWLLVVTDDFNDCFGIIHSIKGGLVRILITGRGPYL